MNLLKWIGWQGSARSLAMSSFKRGLVRIKKHDDEGAMEDLTAAIETADAPADVKAMALYNRALLFAATHDVRKATDDLQAVLASEAPLPDIKLAARRRLERMRQRSVADTALRPVQKSSNQS